ncbi:hypothetical protein NP233_g1018 [Leucocoprinus birnbaumii]|uniref:RNA-directed DNA polymerase n=1 Tax=Leucocoprinus birnbaumii TaxID=56174 RepID=A0AAD5W3B2_9AGAR|nr:hypothetical protein NP233_g1018 [Leucocoprinus birnbaumii]
MHHHNPHSPFARPLPSSLIIRGHSDNQHLRRPNIPKYPISAFSTTVYDPNIPKGKPNGTPPPRLMHEEREILLENKGCTKCRKIRPRHILEHRICDEPFPSGDGYRPVAWRTSDHELTKNLDLPERHIRKGSLANIADTVKSDISEQPVDNALISPQEPIDTGFNSNSNFYTPLPSARRRTDSIMTPKGHHYHVDINSVEDNRLTSVAQNTVRPPKTLLWDCKVMGSEEFPIKTRALIDTGASVSMIHEHLAMQLGLERHTLKEPTLITTATNAQASMLEYVILSLSSSDLEYTALPTKALISPTLNRDIILGMPFLRKNAVNIDTAESKVTDNRVGYTLIGQPVEKPQYLKRTSRHVKIPTAHERLSLTWKYRRTLLEELKSKLGKIREDLDRDAVVERPLNEIVNAITTKITNTEEELILAKERAAILNEFQDVFSDIPHVNQLPTDVLAEIRLKDPNFTIKPRVYGCPRKYRDTWKGLIHDHLDAGRIRPSTAPNASPAFVIPKADPTAPPRWVNDYRTLNKNTIPDPYPLPRIDEILADCGRGKIWGTIDMTNAFFQTRMKPEHIPLTAVSTPFGNFEWVVMPMGIRNAPAIHQRRVNQALHQYLGKFCHIYLDDIIIWSNSVDEHRRHTQLILKALQDAGLYCNLKKTKLFQTEVNFLGHYISRNGISPDDKRLNELSTGQHPLQQKRSASSWDWYEKECEYDFPEWTPAHQAAFQGIKDLVLSADCLTVIDHDLMPEYRVFVTTDASDTRSGAMLSFGKTWETSRPVAFEKLFAIVRALTKWRNELLGLQFTVLTDHRTLECFETQKHLTRRQARWMELLQQYDFEIVYIKGDENSVADALSRTNFGEANIEMETWHHCPSDRLDELDELDVPVCSVLLAENPSPWESVQNLTRSLPQPCNDGDKVANSIMTVDPDDELRATIVAGYLHDPWCEKARKTKMDGLTFKGDLMFFKDRLIIPRVGNIRETILGIAHKILGHFGFDKTYTTLKDAFYWPGMRTYLEQTHIPGCEDCQKNKAPTSKPVGPLHPLPVPDGRFKSIAMDFVGPLPEENGCDQILTITDRLGADVRLIPCKKGIKASELAELFFNHWYCENGLPEDIVSDRDVLFLSKFWQHFMDLLNVDLKMSTAFHPQTDGSSERTNKTLNQMLRYHVNHQQQGWYDALPKVRFAMMNTQNASMGYTGFQLRMGFSPRVIPAMIKQTAELETESPAQMLDRLAKITADAQDNLFMAKVNQAAQANKHRTDNFPFSIGDQVLLSTKNRFKEIQGLSGDKIVSKLAPRFDGPYEIINIDEPHSTVTLDIPGPANKCKTFHTSQVKQFVEPLQVTDKATERVTGEPLDNVTNRRHTDPTPIMTRTGPEHVIEKILEHRPKRGGYEFLIKWRDFPNSEEHNEWMTTTQLRHTIALEKYLRKTGLDPSCRRRSD